ncbi:Nmad3 family putative nucleotide modification protein [Bradyrhizobium australiense]|uniref:Nucleotide modification associated domain-containing protein n=1 Tax=Bradyrhizobium australiense TaxID=2721161 RepID=A0A7Y4GQ80_9BRAD|nr:hypothetical protein [Bradyrhizobium australiense]NOJ39978.1 hypothetical protein [Bradyrhizobium australiense]
MNALLCRVGADQTVAGGSWNGLVNSESGEFVYVAIPESRQTHPGMEIPYSSLQPFVEKFGCSLPVHLHSRHMHLDPDFDHLTYGDRGERAKQIKSFLSRGDLLVFYSGLRDAHAAQLVYAIIGVFVVQDIKPAIDVPPFLRNINAHSRRVLDASAQDVVVVAKPGVSGRLKQCLPIGEWRDRAYRVRNDVLSDWGGLSVKDGYLQRSARLPRFRDPARFLKWLDARKPILLQSNN